jgi:hypothetical protein
MFDQVVDNGRICLKTSSELLVNDYHNHAFIQGKAGSVVTSHAFAFVGYQNCVPTSEKQPNNQQQVNMIAGHAMQGMCYMYVPQMT